MVRTSVASLPTSTERHGKGEKGQSTMPNAILDPTGTVTTTAKPAAPRAKRPASLKGARVGLLINTKQNAAPFLDEVGRLLTENYGVGSVTARTKLNFAVPETEDVIKELAAENDVIVTTSFRATTEAMAELRGAPGFPYATTEHPVAVLTEDKVKERAALVLEDVVKLLTEAEPRA